MDRQTDGWTDITQCESMSRSLRWQGATRKEPSVCFHPLTGLHACFCPGVSHSAGWNVLVIITKPYSLLIPIYILVQQMLLQWSHIQPAVFFSDVSMVNLQPWLLMSTAASAPASTACLLKASVKLSKTPLNVSSSRRKVTMSCWERSTRNEPVCRITMTELRCFFCFFLHLFLCCCCLFCVLASFL